MTLRMGAPVIEYLMAGDPVIRWQTMRDLLDEPESVWRAERPRVSLEGWGARFLSHQLVDGSWPVGRWTGTVWTLVTLVELGMPGEERFRVAFERVVERLMPVGVVVSAETLKKEMDLCHLGFWLRIGAHFCPEDPRLGVIAETLLSVQMADGGWNCRIRTQRNVTHSSFHTVLNVLEGLRGAASVGLISAEVFAQSETRALEFMLEHKLYRSDKTGRVVDPRFMALSFPSYWHYTVLRGLDYIRSTSFIKDPRLEDPLGLLESQRKSNGRWPVEKRIPGDTLFDMEGMGKDSRWNTLRALRVLRTAERVA
jgi:hypothetical protein